MGNGHRDFPFGYTLGNPPTLRKFLSRIRKAEPCCFGGSYRGLLEPPPWAPPLSHPLPPTPQTSPLPAPQPHTHSTRRALSGLSCPLVASAGTASPVQHATPAGKPSLTRGGPPGPTSASGNQEAHPGATARQGQSRQEGPWDLSPPPFTSANV